MNERTRGFSIIEVSLVVVVIAIVGAVGYLAYTNFGGSKKQVASTTSSTVSQNEDSDDDITVSSVNDLSTIDRKLDAVEIDDSESAQFETTTNSF